MSKLTAISNETKEETKKQLLKLEREILGCWFHRSEHLTQEHLNLFSVDLFSYVEHKRFAEAIRSLWECSSKIDREEVFLWLFTYQEKEITKETFLAAYRIGEPSCPSGYLTHYRDTIEKIKCLISLFSL